MKKEARRTRHYIQKIEFFNSKTKKKEIREIEHFKSKTFKICIMEKVTQNVPDTGWIDPDEFVNDPCIEAIEDEEPLNIE